MSATAMPLKSAMVIVGFLICILHSLVADDDVGIQPSHHHGDQTASSSAASSPVSSWPGHLKPLGSAANHLPIAEIYEFPSPIEFFKTYVYPSVPVVFRRGAERSPAFEKWTDDYLRSFSESEEMIDVEVRKVENRSMPTKRMSFVEFVDRYRAYDEYLVAAVPEFLKTDVLVPPSLRCDNVTANFVDTIMWFSSGGTKSVLHNDDVDNLNCLFSGEKEILFVNYTKYRKQIVFDHPEGSYSGVNVDEVDFNKYPELHDVEFFKANMEAGDCIFIPYKWYHQVNSIGRNIAVNIWWNHRANIVPTEVTCGNPDPGMSLADVKFFFQDIESMEEGEIPPELAFLEDPGQSLTNFMEEENMNSLTQDQFLGFLSQKMSTLQGGIWNEEALDLGHEIFKMMDLDASNRITSQDIDALPTEEEWLEGGENLRLQQKLVMLIDVVDEEVSKKRMKLLKKLEGNPPSADYLSTALPDGDGGHGNSEEQSLAGKDEL